MKRMLLLYFVSLVLYAESPCFLTQLDRTMFGEWERMPVYGVSARSRNCPEAMVDLINGNPIIYSPINYVLDRWDGERWTQAMNQLRVRYDLGSYRRAELFVLDAKDLGGGFYRLISANGGQFLEALYFTIGAVEEVSPQYAVSRQLRLATGQPDIPWRGPYIKASAVVVSGYLYFRGDLGGVWANGYLYQPRLNETEVLPVEVERVNPQDTIFVNQPFVRGGTLDLSWCRVRLPNNLLDLTRPIYLSVTADGGGVTVTSMVYDPSDPARIVDFSSK